MKQASTLRTPIKRARGLGSAHYGAHHFWVERVTAVALIPLTVWFMVSLLTALLGGDRYAVNAWFANPYHAVLMAALIVLMFKHAQMGVQVIIEDYVQHEGKKLSLLLINSAVMILLGGASLLAVVRLHFFETI